MHMLPGARRFFPSEKKVRENCFRSCFHHGVNSCCMELSWVCGKIPANAMPCANYHELSTDYFFRGKKISSYWNCFLFWETGIVFIKDTV